ncbi:hypothetical protein AMATHDRAFT_60674, partial [Amanita thiersii Skay4041]
MPLDDSLSLSPLHVTDALSRSPDYGTTLALSKLNVSEVTLPATHALVAIGGEGKANEKHIERLTLGNNHLSNLPAEFTLLTHLRYLNLKHNNFTTFPNALTAMPSLEILDISHNKLASLPSQPGQLVNLKVLCLARNKLSRLPSYIHQFHKLEVLQVDRNPIEWPPQPVLNFKRKFESEQTMKEWIINLRKWMEASPGPKRDDLSYFELEREMADGWRYPTKNNDNIDIISHSRSYSVESSLSFASIPESVSDLVPSKEHNGNSQRHLPLHLGILRSSSDDSSPTRSLDSNAASPAESEIFDGPSFTTVNGEESFDAPIQHNRNASYAGQGRQSQYTEVLAKMSMPDLRTAKLDFMRRMPGLPEMKLTISTDTASFKNSSEDTPQIPYASTFDINSHSLKTPKKIIDESVTPATHILVAERDNYFRRLSTSSPSINLPESLVSLIHSARSILFSTCQVYQTLAHYTVNAVDERLSSVLRKVLDPASSDVLQLIASLDRFDAICRKTMPPPATCRAVIESCRDTVSSFNKVVGVLKLQLQVLIDCDDVRYSRLLLVELYSATAEIACAWKNMAPQLNQLKSFLHPRKFYGQPLSLPFEGQDRKGLSTSPLPDSSTPTLRYPTTAVGPSSTNVTSRARITRRHAGSFSIKDVEIGKQLPSMEDLPGLNGSSVSSFVARSAALRTPKRQATTPATLPSAKNTPRLPPSPAISRSPSRGVIASGIDHSRQGSLSSGQNSASSSPSIPHKIASALEIPSSSRLQVDKEALQAVKGAVEIAPVVWDMMEDSLEDVLLMRRDIRAGLDRARVVTKRLTDLVNLLQEHDNVNDRRLLREDARLFLKAVVQLSSTIKVHKETQDMPPILRNNMVKLTNATEEFAILLHVSSFSPANTRPFSPMVAPMQTPVLSAPPLDSQLASSLSRSRSAQATPSIKVNTSVRHEGPRSALPMQSFKIPTVHTKVRDPRRGIGEQS